MIGTHNIDEPQMHSSQKKKAYLTSCILYDLFLWDFCKAKAKRTKKIIQLLLEDRRGVWDDYKRPWRYLRAENIALSLDCGGGYMSICPCQNSQNYTFKRLNFPICKLYLNKTKGEKNLFCKINLWWLK